MATITQSYAEQLATLKAQEAGGTMPSFAAQVAAAEALYQSEERPFSTLDAKYVIYATDDEMTAALARKAAEAADPVIIRNATDAAEQAAIKQDASVTNFLNMTPAALEAWVDNNIAGAANLAELRTACTTAFKVLGKLAQQGARGRRLRNGT